MFKAIQEQITYLYKEKRQPLLLAIDEAQYLSTGILNDIKMLMNYGYDSVNYFTLILCGESHLNDTLRKPVHEALRQWLTIHYNYAGLSDDEVSKYILHKLQLSGASSTIIDPAVLAAAHSFTQGNPRFIDDLMTDALTIGSQQDTKVIDAEIIRAAVDNQGGKSTENKVRFAPPTMCRLTISTLLSVVGFIIFEKYLFVRLLFM